MNYAGSIKRNFEETKVWYDGYRLTKSEDSMPQNEEVL